MLHVGDWLGIEDGHEYWTDENLAFWYERARKRVRYNILTVRNRGWDDNFVKNGCNCPTKALENLNEFRKEIKRRKSYNVYFGIK
tara:strand:- start:60 stop:314 length:255 start_codon:yes stop_codon:yes gene_type:complete